MSAPTDESAPTRGSAGVWTATALIVGSVVAVDPGGFAPFGPVRWTVVALLGIVIVATALRGRIGIERRSAIAWSVLLGWLAVAAARGIDPVHVWWGTPERRLGWLSWLLFALLFVAGQQLRSGGDLRVVARGGALGSLALGSWTLLELVDVAPVAVELADGRVGGPYGQPTYVAAAAVLLAPLAAASALDRTERAWWRIVAAAASVVGGVAVLASQTRGAWIAATVVAVALVIVHRRSVLRPAAIVAVVVLAVVLGVPTLRDRAASITDVADAGRWDEWRIASATVLDDPLVGTGPEGYRIAVTEHVDAAYEREHGRRVLPDRAHDSLLDVAAVGGLPAATAYITVVGFVVAAAIGVIRRGSLAEVGLGAAVLAHVVQGVFLFPLLEVDPAFWLLAGVVVARSGAVTWTVSLRSWAMGPLAAAFVIVAFLGVRDVRADRDLAAANDLLRSGDQRAALEAADRATDRRPDSIRAWFVASRVASSGGTILDVDAALDRIESGLERSPRDPALRTERTRLLLDRAGRSGSSADIDAAVDALTDLVGDDPVHAEHRLRLGVALALDGRLDAAEVELRRAADLAPGARAPLVDLARVEILRGDIDAAQAAIDELDTPTGPK